MLRTIKQSRPFSFPQWVADCSRPFFSVRARMVSVINADGQRPKKDELMFIPLGRSMHLVNVPLVTDQSICYNNTSLTLSSK